MNRNARKSPRHPDPSTIARAAAISVLAAALIGVPAVAASARPVVDQPRVLGYGSGV